MLSVIAGGLRRYLEHHNELPDESLSVSIPLDMRTRRGLTDENNQVGSVFVELHTNIADPLERLAAVYKSSQEAKIYGENSPLVDVLRLAGVMSPAITTSLVSSYVNNGLTRHLPLGISSVVSNVAGPNFPLYSAGAQMVRYYGLGLLTPGVGLFHLIFSSNGIMTMSILGDRNAMPDPAFYRECIEQSFDELLAAAKNIANTDSAAKPTSAPAKRSAAKSSVAKKAASSSASSASAKKPAVTQAVKKPVARKAKSASSAKASASASVNGAVADDTKVVPIKNTVS